jgi:hydrogenase maturation protease
MTNSEALALLPLRYPFLIIGYGNDLRGDDAAGPRAAEAIEGWNKPGLKVIIRHQLTPELAETLSQAHSVIFIDAAVNCSRAQMIPVSAEGAEEMRVHLSNPESLMALAQAVFGRMPQAWLVTIPAVQFEFGAMLSEATQKGIADALGMIREKVEDIGGSRELAPPDELGMIREKKENRA